MPSAPTPSSLVSRICSVSPPPFVEVVPSLPLVFVASSSADESL
jgi:hypothetical protein